MDTLDQVNLIRETMTSTAVKHSRAKFVNDVNGPIIYLASDSVVKPVKINGKIIIGLCYFVKSRNIWEENETRSEDVF
jgi:hypothetical protein